MPSRACSSWAEFLTPAPDGLVGEEHPAFGENKLDLSQAEAEHVIQPDGVADDLGREAMTIMWIRGSLHAASFA